MLRFIQQMIHNFSLRIHTPEKYILILQMNLLKGSPIFQSLDNQIAINLLELIIFRLVLQILMFSLFIIIINFMSKNGIK